MTWIYVFNALLTPVISCVVAYIAYQQHKTNRDKLRFDMYDRRKKVFEGLRVLLWVIFRKETCNDQERDQFQRATVEGNFLFDKDIANYLDTIYKNALKLGTVHAVLNNVQKGEQANDKERQLLDWFKDQFEVSKEKFARYLNFRQSTNVFERQNMKWKRGFKRIIWILSVLAGIAGFFISLETIYEDLFAPILAISFFAAVWVIYWVISWAVRGFYDDVIANKEKEKIRQ